MATEKEKIERDTGFLEGEDYEVLYELDLGEILRCSQIEFTKSEAPLLAGVAPKKLPPCQTPSPSIGLVFYSPDGEYWGVCGVDSIGNTLMLKGVFVGRYIKLCSATASICHFKYDSESRIEFSDYY